MNDLREKLEQWDEEFYYHMNWELTFLIGAVIGVIVMIFNFYLGLTLFLVGNMAGVHFSGKTNRLLGKMEGVDETLKIINKISNENI